MAVTPWGDLYPCHQFVGDDKFLLGNIWTGVTNTAVRDEFAAAMFMRARSAATAGQGSIAPAAVPQMRIIPRVPFAAFMNTAAICSAKGWNAR